METNTLRHQPELSPELAARVKAVLATLALPQGVRYDAVQLGLDAIGRDAALQFTDIDPKSPAYGATFYLRLAEATTPALIRKTAAKRLEFRTASMPLPPAVQRAPRHFAPAGESNHY